MCDFDNLEKIKFWAYYMGKYAAKYKNQNFMSKLNLWSSFYFLKSGFMLNFEIGKSYLYKFFIYKLSTKCKEPTLSFFNSNFISHFISMKECHF